jgi:hypothetical protein
MPKSKRRKPGRPGLDHSAAAKLRFFSLAKVLTECQTEPLEPEEHQGFVMPAYECLEKLRTGDAEAFEYQQLYYMLLTGLEIVSLVHSKAANTETLQAIEPMRQSVRAALDAMRSIDIRFAKTGRIGTAADELNALRHAVRWIDEAMQNLTRGEFARAEMRGRIKMADVLRKYEHMGPRENG